MLKGWMPNPFWENQERSFPRWQLTLEEGITGRVNSVQKRHEEEWPRQVLCYAPFEAGVWREVLLRGFNYIFATNLLWDFHQII